MGQLIGFGEACGLGSALCWGTSTLVLRSYGERLAPAWTNSVRCATASAFYWALLLGGRELGQLLHAPFDALARLLGTVVLGIGIGDTFYLHALRRMDASRTLALTGTYPVSAVIFSQLLLHERISLLLFAGVALVGRDRHRWRARRPGPGETSRWGCRWRWWPPCSGASARWC